jgi:F0F1-type ATP synthase membrane subunit b/b'
MAKAEKKVVKSSQPEEQMTTEPKQKSIMVKPLPVILDEIEDSIGQADEAAKDARKAAEEARLAGEKAANEAARVAAQAIARVETIARSALELAQLLNATLMDAATGVEKKLSGKK